MDGISQISEFGKILIFLITGILAVAFAFFVSRRLSPNNPNAEKLTSYECGEEPTGSAWMPFNSRFYVIALIFLLFDVEMVFILPWATVFGDKTIISIDNRWGWLSLIEMFVFLGILILGLVYVWAKGDLDWIKPKPVIPTTDTQVPVSLYDQLNKQQSAYKVKDFALELTAVAPEQTATATATPLRKPMFKPTFKKPDNES
ncbi:NADH-quinone oxidoreductase subunit A [Mucilaginibacter ginsenosidivorans]|uniref:NADH-quinone oxidoreductase subunit A n=1 Tax=Mucilaginibacter ginsenosidivorans TaxID=398053 RepID=A0A5B8UZA1_9SPHI|nr:NADH-quinone oxidoreductase subunit A [Mucilaginibacter ginsenosidivorans]QEC63933.1 NADH-quinone oxidoreductase subunit A [Mucilaginibacter ginsenosidivorans]